MSVFILMASDKDLPLWAFDTEDDSKGNPHMFNFYNGRRHFTFKTQETAIEFLLNGVKRAQVWSCVAEYDVTNLFGQYNELLCEMTYLKSAFVKARMLNLSKGCRITFYDTLRHWKMGVATMGEKLGLPKLEFNPNSVKYCQRDTEIVWKWVALQRSYYENLGTTLNATIGSSAMQLWKSKFNGETIPIEPKMREFLYESCRGGRVEIFRTGVQHGKIEAYDVNSLYPFIMRSMQYPMLDGGSFTRFPNFEREGAIDATVLYPPLQGLPCLPFRRGKLLFPTGKFRGVFCYPEIRQALKDGAQILKIHKAAEFSETCRPFVRYVDALYNRRKNSKDEQEQDTLKLFMNNLFGKFGAHNSLELWRGPTKKERATVSKDSNMIWAAYTTSYARLHLLKLLRAYEPYLLYCDTDSIFVKDCPAIQTSKDLGALKKIGEWRTAHFVLPKVYMLDTGLEKTFKAKGVPKKLAEKFFEDYSIEFDSPLRYRESFKRGIKANVWIKKTRELKHQYDKRVVLKDGSTRPLTIR